MVKIISLLIVGLLLAACSEEASSPVPNLNEPRYPPAEATITQPGNPLTLTLSVLSRTEEPPIPGLTPMITASKPTSIQSTSTPGDWRELPVIPTVSVRAVSIYQRGLASGNNPRAFSKIGDGNISTEWFFSKFDQGAEAYDLGPYEDLSEVIAQFSGSFGRRSITARRGFNTSKLLGSRSDAPEQCLPKETALDCELRTHRPSIAILSLGTNQIDEPEIFERELRQILDLLVDRGVVPLLSTKADNREGDHSINHIISGLASEYEIPLWNFWRAVQPLPDHGLQEDKEHLTYGPMNFRDENALQTAWTVRNLTALQALDAVWRGLNAGGEQLP